MKRNDFIKLINSADDKSLSFLNYFVRCLLEMQAEYTSKNTKIPDKFKKFSAVGVEKALESYVWPSSIVTIDESPGHKNALDYKTTKDLLQYCRDGLAGAIESRNNVLIIKWCNEIIAWGMGGVFGLPALSYLIRQPNISQYFENIRPLKDLTEDNEIAAKAVDYYDSGLSKIHAIESYNVDEPGLIIYDSRVAFAIAECVSEWVKLSGLKTIPEHLQFMHEKRVMSVEQTKLNPRYHSRGIKHPKLKKNDRFLENQKRASWLFQKALEHDDSKAIWTGQDLVTRMHNLEAAFFMFGAYADILKLPDVNVRQRHGIE